MAGAERTPLGRGGDSIRKMWSQPGVWARHPLPCRNFPYNEGAKLLQIYRGCMERTHGHAALPILRPRHKSCVCIVKVHCIVYVVSPDTCSSFFLSSFRAVFLGCLVTRE